MPENKPDSADCDALVLALTEKRKQMGLSMRAVARMSIVPPSCVHSWEHGTRDPSLGNLRAWARALGFRLTLTPVEGCIFGEFTEDINDASMCMCGVPALTHDQVYPTSVLTPVDRRES